MSKIAERSRLLSATGVFMIAGLVAVGSGVAQADPGEEGAVVDTVVTGSGVPVTVNVLTNDVIPAGVRELVVGTETGPDSTVTVKVNPDNTITFVNDDPDFPNGRSARCSLKADFTIPYTVTDNDGQTYHSTLTVTVAGQPVDNYNRMFIWGDSTAVGTTSSIYNQIFGPSPCMSGHNVHVARVEEGAHTTATVSDDGETITVLAKEIDFAGFDVMTVVAKDQWGRESTHRLDVAWSRIIKHANDRVKIRQGESYVVDVDALAQHYGWDEVNGTLDQSNIKVTKGTYVLDSSNKIRFTPDPSVEHSVGAHDGPALGYFIEVANPNPSTGSGTKTTSRRQDFYIDVQAPPVAVDVAAQTDNLIPVKVNVKSPATLPWRDSSLTITSDPSDGTAEIINGNILYTPTTDLKPGTEPLVDTVGFTWTDDLGQTSAAKLTITVQPAAGGVAPPTATPDPTGTPKVPGTTPTVPGGTSTASGGATNAGQSGLAQTGAAVGIVMVLALGAAGIGLVLTRRRRSL